MGLVGRSSNKKKDGDDKSSYISTEKEEGRMSLFQRLFAPESIETDVSGDSESGSFDSATNFTDMSDGSEDEENDESTGEPSATSTMIKFDRDLRARHRGACKNMTVRKVLLYTTNCTSALVQSL